MPAFLCPVVSPTPGALGSFLPTPQLGRPLRKWCMASEDLGWEGKIKLDLPCVQVCLGLRGFLGQGTCGAKTRTVLGKAGWLVTLPNTVACEELAKESGVFSLERKHLDSLLWSISKESSWSGGSTSVLCGPRGQNESQWRQLQLEPLRGGEWRPHLLSTYYAPGPGLASGDAVMSGNSACLEKFPCGGQTDGRVSAAQCCDRGGCRGW